MKYGGIAVYAFVLYVFLTPSQDLGLDYGVPLANSVSMADINRIQHCIDVARKLGIKDPFTFRHGK